MNKDPKIKKLVVEGHIKDPQSLYTILHSRIVNLKFALYSLKVINTFENDSDGFSIEKKKIIYNLSVSH